MLGEAKYTFFFFNKIAVIKAHRQMDLNVDNTGLFIQQFLHTKLNLTIRKLACIL